MKTRQKKSTRLKPNSVGDVVATALNASRTLFVIHQNLRPVRGWFSVVIALAVLSSMVAVLQPAVVAALIDDLPIFGVRAGYVLILMIVVLVLLQALLGYCQSRMGERLIRNARLYLSSRIARVSSSASMNNYRGRLTSSILQDVNALRDGITGPVRETLTSCVVLVGALGSFTLIDVRLAVAVFTMSAVAIVAALLGVATMRRISMQQLEVRHHLTNQAQDHEATSQVRRVYFGNASAHKNLDSAILEVETTNANAALQRVRYGSISDFFFQMAVSGTAAAAALVLLPVGQVTSGQIAQVFLLGALVTGPMRTLVGVCLGWQGTRAAIDRLSEIWELPQEDLTRGVSMVPDYFVPRISPNSSGIEICDLSVRFGQQTVVRGVTASLSDSGTVAIVGRSGSGKSTLLRAIAGFAPVSDGAIRIDGTELNPVNVDSLRGNIGWVDQSNMTIGSTLSENIFVLGTKNSEEVRGMIASLNLLPTSETQDVLGRSVATMSGGERQRVALLRAILSERKVILMDEPTSALDVETARAAWQITRANTSQLTVFVTHNLDFAKEADRVLMLEQGQLVFDGAASEFEDFLGSDECPFSAMA